MQLQLNIEAGRLKNRSVEIPQRRGEPVYLIQMSSQRKDASFEGHKLRPVIRKMVL